MFLALLWYNGLMDKTQTQNASSNVSPESSWLYRLIRLYPHEVSRTFMVWIIRLLYRFVFVVSWTLIVAHVASTYHSEIALPVLFLIHAFLVLLGSVLSFFLFTRLPLENIFLYSLIAGVSILFGCQLLVFDESIKIGILLFVESFILVQLSINIETFTERFFTPFESARTFPIAESGDTIATLLAGAFLYFNASQLTMTRVLWVVVAVLSLMIPFFLHYHSFLRSNPGLCLFRKQFIGGEHEEFQPSYVTKIITRHPYIVTLIGVVLAQWFFSVVLEYLFTYSVAMQHGGSGELVSATSGALENVLISEFGALQILFASAALVSHFFLAGRFISTLGIIGSILLHPLVSLLSLAGMITNFGPLTAIVARANAEVTGVIYRNSYQSSYYVFDEMESQFTRIFMDGVIRPLGAMLGTSFLVISYFFVPHGSYLTFVLTGLFIVLLFFALSTVTLQKQYVRLIVHQLKKPDTSLDLKLNLLEVLSRTDYPQKALLFDSIFHDSHESTLVQVKMMEIFARELTHLTEIISGLRHVDPAVRFASISALQQFFDAHYFDTNLLSHRTVVQELMHCSIHETDRKIRLLMLLLLAHFKEKEVLDFLLDHLQNDQGDSLSTIIMACDVFDDPSFHPLIESFLSSADPRVWAHSAVILSRFDQYRDSVRHLIHMKMSDTSRSARVAVAFVLAQIVDDSYAVYLRERLEKSDDALEKVFIAFALVALGEDTSVTSFAHILFNLDISSLDDTSRFLSLVPSFMDLLPPTSRYGVERYLQQHALHKLHAMLQTIEHSSLENLGLADLKKLRNIYGILNATEEILKIDVVIRSHDPSFRPESRFFGKVPLILSAYLS